MNKDTTDEELFCPHDEIHIETVEEEHETFSGTVYSDVQIYVCSICDEQLEGNPRLDIAEYEAEAEAEAQLMEILGK